MIYTQCCGIALLLVLFLFYKMQKRIQLNTEKAFWRTFYATFIVVVLDVVSVLALQNMDRLPQMFVNFLCKAYLIFSMVSVQFSVQYLCSDIFQSRKKIRNASVLSFGPLMLGIILIVFLPIYCYCDLSQSKVYTYGPSVMVAYGIVAVMICSNVILLWIYKEKVNPRRAQAVFVWMLIWAMSALTQFMVPSLLIVGFAQTIGIMILYLRLENPETNLDRRTGLFNSNAFMDYIRQLYSKNQQGAILTLIFDYSIDKNRHEVVENDILMEIIRYLSKIQDAFLFIENDNQIIIVFEDLVKAEETLATLRERFKWGWGGAERIHIHPFWLFIPDIFMVSDVRDVISLIKYARENSREFAENDFVYVDDTIVKRMYQEWETELLIVEALENDKVEVHYQPIFSIQKKRFTSAEALVRIRDAEDKLVPPGVFISVAEKNGMILKLGEVVFEKVCAMIKEKCPEQYGIEYIEINLSVVQCAYFYLAEEFIGIMEKYHVNPRMINLEITESASLSAKKVLLENMRCLMNYGVTFSLDDFGTGQSNLNYIVDMPVDIVKFDRDMTNAYFENGKARYVLDAAMHMIHGMNLEIVSEGIETEKQYSTMEKLGIDYVQGYYFSKPLPEMEFLKFLNQKCLESFG